MKKLIYSFFIFINFHLASAQKAMVEVDMNPANWEIPKNASFEQFDGRETLVMKNGRATVKNQTFRNGTIQVEVYAKQARSFAGITFRKQAENMEEVYMRLHKSSQADAVQYTPIFNDESNWQLYREHQAKVTFKTAGWNTLRIEVRATSAVVFVNDEKVMSVENLRTGQEMGEIGLWTLFGSRFSNFKVIHQEVAETAEKKTVKTADAGIITEWEITKAMHYKASEFKLDDYSKEKYSKVETEVSGLLPISKYVKKPSAGSFEGNQEDFIIATTTVNASEAETKLFTFDYSDKIIVYLNGKPIFKGSNAFRTKGVQYMGHVGLGGNQLFLPLQKGKNTIHCVVIDKANGWGLLGRLE